jgi:copper transport protein
VRRLVLLLVLAWSLGAVVAPWADAHNSLESSEPADRATLATAPLSALLTFAKPVPLETLTVQLVDPLGVRSELSSAVHDGGDDRRVRVTLPALTAGTNTLRWRLVGADGHTVTGRVRLDVPAAESASALTPVPVVAGPGDATGAVTTSVVRETVDSVAASTTVTGVDAAGRADTVAPGGEADVVGVPDSGTAREDDEASASSTPSVFRWLFRLGSYVAIGALIGVLMTAVFVWPKAWELTVLVRAQQVSVAVVAGLGVAQLFVVAGDVAGRAPWVAWSGLDGALRTDVGRAMAVRVALCAALAFVLFRLRTDSEQVRMVATAALCVGLLATWAWAGHSRSQRWWAIGVPIDIVHHGAVGAWLGGIAIVGYVATLELRGRGLAVVIRNFARVAPLAVLAIVATGIVQTLRLTGSPLRLFGAAHGRLLLAKLVVLALMLKVADINRQRVLRRFGDGRRSPDRSVGVLRRAMFTELGLGAVIIALSAALVVAPPAAGDAGDESSNGKSVASASAGVDDDAAQGVGTGSTAVAGSPVDTVAQAQPVVTAAPETTGSAPGSCSVSALVRTGSVGADVACVRTALVRVGALDASVPAAAPAGDANSLAFDAELRDAVVRFQTTRGLEPDGIVGPGTAKALGIG